MCCRHIIGQPELCLSFKWRQTSLWSCDVVGRVNACPLSGPDTRISHWNLLSVLCVFPTLFPSVMRPLLPAQKISVSEAGSETASCLVPGATCGHALVFSTPFLAPLHESIFAALLASFRAVWSVEAAYVQTVLEAASTGLFLTFCPFPT